MMASIKGKSPIKGNSPGKLKTKLIGVRKMENSIDDEMIVK